MCLALLDTPLMSTPHCRSPGRSLLSIEAHSHLVGLVRLVPGDAPDIRVIHPQVGVQAIHVGECVVPHDVLLLPHEGGGAHYVQGQAQAVAGPVVAGQGAVVGVVLDGDARLGHQEAQQDSRGQCSLQAKRNAV